MYHHGVSHTLLEECIKKNHIWWFAYCAECGVYVPSDHKTTLRAYIPHNGWQLLSRDSDYMSSGQCSQLTTSCQGSVASPVANIVCPQSPDPMCKYINFWVPTALSNQHLLQITQHHSPLIVPDIHFIRWRLTSRWTFFPLFAGGHTLPITVPVPPGHFRLSCDFRLLSLWLWVMFLYGHGM